MTQLFLVRHGDAVWTLDEMRPLSARGWQQAEAVADALAPLAPAALYSIRCLSLLLDTPW